MTPECVYSSTHTQVVFLTVFLKFEQATSTVPMEVQNSIRWKLASGTPFLSKISKVDYSSKAKCYNVGGVSAFFDTCSN